ncbi:hypothetical protein [Pontibacter sp. G13]|uniref:hypothetical protein n=1 Tax=Pontibacter sp. G13 TaxID=3074898 RepID=UPI00288A131C|nr:hypothetical protein [Pontibacter sp. G13]WNJ19316.1 hypothetical protein RJD25_02390 [Pontibacter sp. G13]
MKPTSRPGPGYAKWATAILFGAFCLFGSIGFAQDRNAPYHSLLEQDRTIVESLSMYPDDILKSVLVTAQYPDALTKISQLQNSTQIEFLELVQIYAPKDQEALYELARYPGVIHALVKDGKMSKAELKEWVPTLPEEIQAEAKRIGRKRFDALSQIDQMNANIDIALDELVRRYPREVQGALYDMVGLPEIMEVLTSNMTFAVNLGAAYRDDPAWTASYLKQVAVEVAEAQASELADFQAQLAADPEAYREMQQAARQYAKDQGEQYDYNKYQNMDFSPEVNVRVYHHYSYWYGYPYWFSTPYWRPMPWYMHAGFVWGPGGNMVFFGLPSAWYMHWQYRYYPYRYAHLNAHYYRHYQRHPHSQTRFHRSVRNEVVQNPNVPVNRPGRPIGPETNRPTHGNQSPSTRPPSTQRPARDIQPPTQRPTVTPARPSVPSNRPATPTVRPAPTTRPSMPTPTQRPVTTPSNRGGLSHTDWAPSAVNLWVWFAPSD